MFKQFLTLRNARPPPPEYTEAFEQNITYWEGLVQQPQKLLVQVALQYATAEGNLRMVQHLHEVRVKRC